MTNYLALIDKMDIMITLMSVPCILIALTFHEVAHGWMAYKLGDPTAKNLGRLTLNPLKHLDPIGTVCMLCFGYGWARPVPINSRYFKKNKRDTALTAAAGPIMNFILAFVALLISRIISAVYYRIGIDPTSFSANLFSAANMFFTMLVTINLSLGVFNLIPVPPLDGSRIFLVFLPPKYYFGVMKYERTIMIVLLLLLATNIVSLPINSIVMLLYYGMESLISLIPFL